MSNLRTSTRALTASGLLCFGTAALIAGCGGGGSSSSPTPAGSPVIASGINCASGTGGVAYIPDGAAAVNSGSGGGGSLTIIPFESTSGAYAPSCPPTKLTLPASINNIAISTQGIAIALQSDNKFIGINQLLSGGSPNTFENPQPFPAPSGTPFIANSIAIVPNGNTGFAVGGPFAGFVGVNNFFGLAPTPLPTTTATASPTPVPTSGTATPTPTVTQTPVPFAGLVGYNNVASNSGLSTGLAPASGSRTSVALAPNASTLLVRGSDLATFSLISTLSGYYFTFPADGNQDIATPPPSGINTTLGFTNPTGAAAAGIAGKGLIAYYPGDSSQAVIGQTSTSALALTHVSNLPNGITISGSFSVPTGSATRVTSVAVVPSGAYAIVGTDAGIYIANLSSNSVTTSTVTTGVINSVGVSPDGKYVVAQSGTTVTVYSLAGTVLAVEGTYSVTPATTGDYMVVR